MATAIRVGVLHISSVSAQEQRLGAQLATEYTRELWADSDDTLDVIERAVSPDAASVDVAARGLVLSEGCWGVFGTISIPMSIRVAEWAEMHPFLYTVAHNNPRLRNGRRHTFHIGCPSELTAHAYARYLYEEQRTRVYVLYAGGEFHTYTADIAVNEMLFHGLAVEYGELPNSNEGDQGLLEQIRSWNPDGICLVGASAERLGGFIMTAHKLGGLPPMLVGRGCLCREFVDLTGPAGEGQEFIDLFLRNDSAPDEEKAMHQGGFG